jgi:hypothetical protein
MNEYILRRKIRNWIIFFMVAISLSGITAFPLQTEINYLKAHSGIFPEFMISWIDRVAEGINETGVKYPYLQYGTDWLAFAHIVIALAFIGPLKDPVRNKWVIDWAIISCFLVFPLALIAGPVRDIPVFHRLIDCAFGIIGLVPLYIVKKSIYLLEKNQFKSG